MAIVVVVAEVDSHACESLAVLVVADAGEKTDFGESAVAIVVVEEALHGVVGDKNIGEAIAVVVGKGNAESLAMRIGDSGLLGNVGEGAVPIVVIEDIASRRRNYPGGSRNERRWAVFPRSKRFVLNVQST